MAYLGIFRLECYTTIAIFEISTLKVVKNKPSTHTAKFGIGFAFSKCPRFAYSEGPDLGPDLLYKACRWKHTPQKFYGGQVTDYIHEWQKLTLDKVILQIVRGDSTDFENDITTEHNAKNPSFSPK